MKFNLEGYAETDFLVADRLVRSVFLAPGRVETWNTLRRVTTEPKDVSALYRKEIYERSLDTQLRAACVPVEHNGYEFDIWFNPAIVSATDQSFKATIAHELCHGYLGTHRGHQRSWRRFYVRSLWHYNRQVEPISHLESLVDLMFWRYTKRMDGERTKDFLKRIRLDRDDTLAYAETESDKVAQIFQRIT